MTVVGFDVFNLNPVFPSGSFRTEGEDRFNVSGWSGPCSNLWWSIGDYEESEWAFKENANTALGQCNLTKEDIYKSWDDYRAGGGRGGRGNASVTRASSNNGGTGGGTGGGTNGGTGGGTGMGVDPNNCDQANRVKNTDNSCGDCKTDYKEDSDGNCIKGPVSEGNGFLDTLTSPLAIGVGALALAGIGYFMFFRK